MSLITSISLTLTNPDDAQRFEDLFEHGHTYRPIPTEPRGFRSMRYAGPTVYHITSNYLDDDLAQDIINGPWATGSVLYIHEETATHPTIKIFGPPPEAGWNP